MFDEEKEVLRSSWLDWCSYNEARSRLTVHTKTGAEYVFFEIKREVFEKLKTTESPGRYFNLYIKTRFTGDKMEGAITSVEKVPLQARSARKEKSKWKNPAWNSAVAQTRRAKRAKHRRRL